MYLSISISISISAHTHIHTHTYINIYSICRNCAFAVCATKITCSIGFTDGLSYKGDRSTHAQGTDPRVALGL